MTVDCLRCGAAVAQKGKKPYRKRKQVGYIDYRLVQSDYIVHDCPMSGTTPCWIWRWSRTRNGYAHVAHHGKTAYVNRIQLGILAQPFLTHQTVHTCDNPPCVNPAHISVGSILDNAQDRESKQRNNHVRGNRIGSAKLLDADVLAIRARVNAGESQASVLRDYEISQAQIGRIVRRESWAWL